MRTMPKNCNRKLKIPFAFQSAVSAFLTVKPEPKKRNKKRRGKA